MVLPPNRIPLMPIQRSVSPRVPKKANTSKDLDEQPMNGNAAMLPQCRNVQQCSRVASDASLA
jgi:hypothetical protein